VADWQTLARRAARSAGVPPDLFVALVRQESGGRNVTNPRSGATGPTQLMPGTARGLGVDPHNFQQNLLGGARYLKQQLHTFGGNVDKALAAYNAGPGAVQQYGGIPPYAETRNYVRSIKNMVGHPVTVGRNVRTGSVSPVGTSSSPAGPSALGLTADTSSGVDVSSLLTMLGQQQRKQAPTSGGLPAPAFTAQAAMPGGYQALASGGGPAPKQDLGALLSLVQTQGSTGQPTGTGAVSGAAPPLPAIQAPRSSSGRDGRVSVAAGANRPGAPINPAVTSFVRGVAGLYGQPLTIGTGTNHNRLTINGTESDHWTGNGADIPLAGRALIRAGQDALIQAGMSPAKARKQTGGGYNVGAWQVIFNTDAPGWGNHLTHLHVGRRAR
jgi:hypothetical protein